MNRIANNMTLVCYDITSNKLRRKIEKCMKDFGIRLQFSVFICRLEADGVSRCREKLRKILDTYFKECNPCDSLIIFERFQPDGSVECLLGKMINLDPPLYTVF